MHCLQPACSQPASSLPAASLTIYDIFSGLALRYWSFEHYFSAVLSNAHIIDMYNIDSTEFFVQIFSPSISLLDHLFIHLHTDNTFHFTLTHHCLLISQSMSSSSRKKFVPLFPNLMHTSTKETSLSETSAGSTFKAFKPISISKLNSSSSAWYVLFFAVGFLCVYS
jgi:hypothetical protein